MSENRILYCIPYKQSHDSATGLLTPLFEEKANLITPVPEAEFPNNGKIFVTRGYEKLFGDNAGKHIYKVEASIKQDWDPSSAHDGMSKYVTYDSNIDIVKGLKVAEILDGQFPKPEDPDGLMCSTIGDPPSDPFFLRCLSPSNIQVLVGPLELIRENVQPTGDDSYFGYRPLEKPIGGDWSALNDLQHQAFIFDLELTSNTSIADSHGCSYVVGALPHLSRAKIDLSNTEQILKWARKYLRAQGSNLASKATTVRDMADEISVLDGSQGQEYELRVERLRSLGNKLEKIDGFGGIVSDYMASADGNRLIEKYVSSNRDSLLEEYHREELERLSSQAKEEKDFEIETRQASIRALELEEDELKDRVRKLEDSQAEKEKTELEEIRREKGIIADLSELTNKKKFLNDECEELGLRKQKAETLLSEIQANIGQSQESHKKTLIELKMGLDALSGYSEADGAHMAELSLPKIYKSVSEDRDKARVAVIDSVMSVLKARNRSVNRDQLIVLVTAIFQNLIVTLAGKPGSGKSSSIIELAYAFGIKSSNKYVNVQVQRGWSSDADITGFFNKLTRSYEPDRHGLYRLINALQSVEREHQFSLVLLDEANLSPIEHYWSGFMNASDHPETFTIDGQDGTSLPHGMRFIATVNYDRTTEQLSPRFIDRSPVIYLDEMDGTHIAGGDSRYPENEEKADYSYNDLLDLFGPSENPELTNDENRALAHIMEHHNFLPIEWRKQKAIKHMTHTARALLGGELRALDYAILANVMPMIAGQGPDYRNSIDELSESLDKFGFEKSLARLRGIIRSSKFDAYSFFS